MKLTERQKRFADEYLIDMNAEQAAIKAGYSKKYARGNAYKIVADSCIQEYIKKRMEEKDKELIASQDEVLKYLTKVMRRELKEVVVVTCKKEKTMMVVDESGVPRKQTIREEIPQEVEIPAKLSDANKAAELLGKRYGLFTDKIDVDGNVPIIIKGSDELE